MTSSHWSGAPWQPSAWPSSVFSGWSYRPGCRRHAFAGCLPGASTSSFLLSAGAACGSAVVSLAFRFFPRVATHFIFHSAMDAAQSRFTRPQNANTACVPSFAGTTRWNSRGSGRFGPDHDHFDFDTRPRKIPLRRSSARRIWGVAGVVNSAQAGFAAARRLSDPQADGAISTGKAAFSVESEHAGRDDDGTAD